MDEDAAFAEVIRRHGLGALEHAGLTQGGYTLGGRWWPLCVSDRVEWIERSIGRLVDTGGRNAGGR